MKLMLALFATLAFGLVKANPALLPRQATASATPAQVPNYFDSTLPGPYPGPTANGQAPFLALTNTIPGTNGLPSGTQSFVANEPLETSQPIPDNSDNINIFEYMGNLSPYFPNPPGFGVNEYSLPSNCNITQVHLLHRHGARYPTAGGGGQQWAAIWANATKAGAKANGSLSFLNSWTYQLGEEALVPVGKQELFDSGALHWYNYGRLYDPATRIIARTPTDYRMVESALYFLNGFFGLSWTQNATLEVIWEETGFNNSLSSAESCPNALNSSLQLGGAAAAEWASIYLQNAITRLNSMVTGHNFSSADVYNIQMLCPYETVAFGFSHFCDLFTAEEWKGFEYSIDLAFAGENGNTQMGTSHLTAAFQSPTGRAVGMGWVNELIARLTGIQPNSSLITNENSTLDDSPATFPLNQTLYLDFTHDTNIMDIITALGLTQFSQFLPPTGPPQNQQLIVSHLEPFAARLVLEKIQCSVPIPENRTGTAEGNSTTYMHLLLNQRTVPLGLSYQACGNRSDGWCEYDAFMSTLQTLNEAANFTYACYGEYGPAPYGNITNGAPIS